MQATDFDGFNGLVSHLRDDVSMWHMRMSIGLRTVTLTALIDLTRGLDRMNCRSSVACEVYVVTELERAAMLHLLLGTHTCGQG